MFNNPSNPKEFIINLKVYKFIFLILKMRSIRSKENFNYSREIEQMNNQSPPRKLFEDISNTERSCALGKRSQNLSKEHKNIVNKKNRKICLQKINQQILDSSGVEQSRGKACKSPFMMGKSSSNNTMQKGLQKSSTRRDFQLQLFNINQIGQSISNLLGLVKQNANKSAIKNKDEHDGENLLKNNQKVTIFDIPESSSRNLSYDKQSQIVSRFTIKDKVQKSKQEFSNKFCQIQQIKARNSNNKYKQMQDYDQYKQKSISKKSINGKKEQNLKQSQIYNDQNFLKQQDTHLRGNDRRKSFTPKKYTYFNEFQQEVDSEKSRRAYYEKISEDIANYTKQHLKAHDRQEKLEKNRPDFYIPSLRKRANRGQCQNSSRPSFYMKAENNNDSSIYRKPSAQIRKSANKDEYTVSSRPSHIESYNQIDKQIDRIKKRIQNSQETTRQMEQKYLGTVTMKDKKQSSKIKTTQNLLLDRQDSYLNGYQRYQQNKSSQKYKPKNYARNNEQLSPYRNRQYLKNEKQTGDKDNKSKKSNENNNYLKEDNEFEIKIYPCCYSDGKVNVQEDQNISRIVSKYEIINEGDCEERSFKDNKKMSKIDKEQISKKIANKLVLQIKMDQKMRDLRSQFCRGRNQEKWAALRDTLNRYGLYFTDVELKQELDIQASESNPFQESLEEDKDIINILALHYQQSRKFWSTQLAKTITKKELNQCGYSGKQMDLDQRGYLTLEDFVCFMNLYTSNFFRNRDLYFTFKRFCQEGNSMNRVEYRIFLEKFQ